MMCKIMHEVGSSKMLCECTACGRKISEDEYDSELGMCQEYATEYIQQIMDDEEYGYGHEPEKEDDNF